MKAGARVFQIVDVERVDATNPLDAIKIFVLDKKPKIVECDVFIAGGGMGGVAAAIRASQQGLTVCVSEETSMIGGQMTSQGVSAFDENKYVEETGATKLYQDLRTRIRQHYRNMEGASPEATANERLNPGDCWVSWCAFEPMIGEMALQEIIEEETEGKPQIEFHTRTRLSEGAWYPR
jgi:2-polyprenyl-6-methoxyphenol hydroxylase-like FAD-dependent oxidoreductase